MTTSPYKLAMPARDTFFYNRSFEVAAIQTQAWTWVCGQRRIGKSSLLYRIQDLEREQGSSVPLFFDLTLMDPENISPQELFDTFFDWHHEQGENLSSLGIKPADFENRSPASCFRVLVDKISARGKAVTFLWDEAELLLKVEEASPGFIESLRGHLHGHPSLRFVMASSQALAGLFGGAENVSSFLATFGWVPVPGLGDDEGKSMFFGEQTGGWQTRLPESLVDEATSWCGGHPLLLAEIGHDLWLQSGGKGDKVNEAKYEVSLTRITASPKNKATINDDYRRLTRPQRAIVDLLCAEEGGVPPGELASRAGQAADACSEALGLLRSYGYVEKKSGKVVLRYNFYRSLRPLTAPVECKTTVEQVERIAEPSIFISYSRQDDAYLHALKKSLGALARRVRVDVWDDSRIQPSVPWREEIDRALARATAAVLIISPDFLDSAFINDVELPRLLAAAEARRCKVFCLYARSSVVDQATFDVDGKSVLLTQYGGLNDPRTPLSRLPTEAERDLVYAESAKAIINAAARDARWRRAGD